MKTIEDRQVVDGYKILPKEFTKKGLTHKLVKREGDAAIYEVTKPDWTRKTYEVILIKRHNGYTMGGIYLEPAETYPSSSQWGIYGWTYMEGEDEKINNRFNWLKQNYSKIS